MVACAHHVGERQQRGHQRGVVANRQDDECAISLGNSHRLALSSIDPVDSHTARRAGRRRSALPGRRRRSHRSRGTARRPDRRLQGMDIGADSLDDADELVPHRRPVSLGSMVLYGQRSLPQMAARVTWTRASVGSTRRASGTVSMRTSPAPYMTVARIYFSFQRWIIPFFS